MKTLTRSLLVAVAGLPFALGTGSAYAATAAHPQAEDGVSVSEDRLRLDTDVDVSELDNLVLDIRVTSEDDDADRFGIRSRNTLEDLIELDTDTRAVSESDDDGVSIRALLGLNDLDDIDSDLDVVILNNDDEESEPVASDVTGDENSRSEGDTFDEDAQFVFGE